MDAAKIVVCEVQAESGPKVLPLLAESVRQSRESANLHSHREILPLNDRSADTARIGVTNNWDHLRGNNFTGRVAAFRFRIAVHLDEAREVGAMAKRCLDGLDVAS